MDSILTIRLKGGTTLEITEPNVTNGIEAWKKFYGPFFSTPPDEPISIRVEGKTHHFNKATVESFSVTATPDHKKYNLDTMGLTEQSIPKRNHC